MVSVCLNPFKATLLWNALKWDPLWVRMGFGKKLGHSLLTRSSILTNFGSFLSKVKPGIFPNGKSVPFILSVAFFSAMRVWFCLFSNKNSFWMGINVQNPECPWLVTPNSGWEKRDVMKKFLILACSSPRSLLTNRLALFLFHQPQGKTAYLPWEYFCKTLCNQPTRWKCKLPIIHPVWGEKFYLSRMVDWCIHWTCGDFDFDIQKRNIILIINMGQ